MAEIQFGCEQLSFAESNALERRIIEAECGRNHFGQTVRGVVLTAREARALFDSADGERYRRVIASLQRELAEKENGILFLREDLSGLEGKAERLRAEIQLLRGGSTCPAGARCSMKVSGGAR